MIPADIAKKLTPAKYSMSSLEWNTLRQCGDGFTGRGNIGKRLQKLGYVQYCGRGLRLITPSGLAVLAALLATGHEAADLIEAQARELARLRGVQPQVAVKPLEWVWVARLKAYAANTILTHVSYMVYPHEDGWFMSHPSGPSLPFATPDLAKAAAQADYDARIRAALEAKP
jgi:hypothetical protein